VKAAAADNAFTQYNIGLIYFDLKNYEKALEQAHKAEELGFGRTELRDRLKKVGRWKNAVASTPAENAASASPQQEVPARAASAVQ
jgi:tetratricopeptide (TPR) repeat protein